MVVSLSENLVFDGENGFKKRECANIYHVSFYPILHIPHPAKEPIII